MDQLSVDNALREINESITPVSGAEPSTVSSPEGKNGPAGAPVAMENATRPKRKVCLFGDLTGTQLRVLTNIVRLYANQLDEVHLHFNETGANDARIKELCAETSEILQVCNYEAYLKQKSEDQAQWAHDITVAPAPT